MIKAGQSPKDVVSDYIGHVGKQFTYEMNCFLCPHMDAIDVRILSNYHHPKLYEVLEGAEIPMVTISTSSIKNGI
jgi:hypothetical protein